MARLNSGKAPPVSLRLELVLNSMPRLASGKVLLIGIVFSFAFVTMIGGNPQHDAYGFRYWNNPVSTPRDENVRV